MSHIYAFLLWISRESNCYYSELSHSNKACATAHPGNRQEETETGKLDMK
ncbi:predicted protein [Brucella suis bv. 4 str. 40]|nr:predicted protein [Brucella melitensis bv. 1 str. 16M]EEW91124.1 predicted protein [Brucella suis bv. 4 str. 40]